MSTAPPDRSLDPRFTFERFVPGAASRLALAAARRAAESPGGSYNPLVLCGPPGLGKTHLLHAIGHLARTLHPGLPVTYAGLETWGADGGGSLLSGSPERSGAALLLVDDLPALRGKPQAQEALLLALEAAQRGAIQLVAASDLPLARLDGFEPRLLTRLVGGLTVDVGTPEAETRAGILRQLLAERGVPVAEDLLAAVAALPLTSVRELHGAANRMLASAELEGRPPTLADVLPVIGAAPPSEGPFRSSVPSGPDLGDPAFLDPERLALDWVGVEERIVEELH